MKNSVANIKVLNQPLIYGDVGLELQKLKWRMMMQVVRILMSFLVFSMANNHFKAHNMLMIMLEMYSKLHE
jgi:hypothetical protein